MDKIKVSIIIPVYNAGKYLHECINSLINQTLKECEFIFINDESTDNSEDIIKKYSSSDSRIILISQKNTGISGARNSGLQIAKGEYIGFLDNDDYVKEDIFETLYKEAKNIDVDIIISQTILGRDNKYIIKEPIFPPYQLYNSDFITTKIIPNLLLKEDLFAVWNKFYKAKFIKENNIHFPNNRKIEEDGMFNFSAFSQAKKVFFIDYAGYFYRDVSSSESRKLIEADLFVKAIEKYNFDYKKYFNLSIDSNYVERLKFSRLFNRVCYLIFILSTNTKYNFKEAFSYSKDMISNNIFTDLKNKDVINTSGALGIIIKNIINGKSINKLYILMKLLRLGYTPKISEFLRKFNKL